MDVILGKVKSGIDVLDRHLSKLGEPGASLVLTLIVVSLASGLHFTIRALEHQPIRLFSVCNMVAEIAMVATPIIFYSRSVIAALKRSRAEMRDLSRRLAIAVEEAEEGSRAKSAFLANMSHELRTPLNAILGFSEIMKDQHLGPVHNPRYLGYAADIHASGRYLLGIINDILDLAKIESGKMSLDSAEEFALAETVEASLAMVASQAEKCEVMLHADLPPAEMRLVAVERMVRQILINLVGNAIKFTPAGGSVSVAWSDADSGCRLTVRDTGIGMRPNDIVHALTPFGQVKSKLQGKHAGTGLGLPLAKAMMELHGGSLKIESKPDQGTCVTLDFPVERLATAKRAAA